MHLEDQKPPAPLMKRTVLIIDDDAPGVELLIHKIRKRWGIPEVVLEILWFQTLAEGLAQKQKANVTLLDLVVPDSDRENSINTIDQLPAPVIVRSGHVDADTTFRCLARGAHAVIEKGHEDLLIATLFEALLKDLLKSARDRENGNAG